MSTASLAPPRAVAAPGLIAIRRIFSFPAMLGSLLVVLMVFTVRGRFSDPDMWWHLKTGQVIWDTHVVPTTDLFSYTTNHHAWTPHEWLSQVFLYAIYHFTGYSGLMVWLCVMGSVLLVAAYTLCSLYSGNAKVALLGGMVVWLFSTIGLAVRPQMIGYSLLICELLILHLARTRNARWLFLLPPLCALWINCHGSFFLGLIVAVVFLFSAFFNFRLGSLVAIPWNAQARKVLAVVVPLSAAALLLNPTGIKQVMYPIETLVSLPLAISSISEWQPMELSNNIRGVAMLVVTAAILLLAVTRRAELLWHELLLLGLGFWLALGHQRMLFVFGILAAPTLCRMLATSWENYDFARDRVLPNAVLMGLAGVAAILAIPKSQALTAQVVAGNPVRAVDYMKSHHLSGHLLNEYVFGGYLIWAAPEYPVFVDGRGDVFEWTGVLADLDRWALLQGDPQDLLKKYDIDICLLARGAPMTHVLPLLGWKAVYSDDMSMVFTRTPVSASH